MYPFRNQFLNNGPQKDPFSSPYGKLLFDSPPEDETNFQVSPTPQAPSYQDAYRELISRKPGPALSAYSKFLEGGYPKEEDTKPNKLTRLGAILSGAAAGFTRPGSGSEVAQSLISRPYEQRVRQYGMEGQRLKEGAALEESIGSRQLPIIKAMQDDENKRADNIRADRNATSLEAVRQSQIDTAKLTRQKLEYDLKTQGYVRIDDKSSGHTYMVNKLNPEDKIDLGISDQSSSDKLRDDKSKAAYSSGLSLSNQKIMSDINFGNQKTLKTIPQTTDASSKGRHPVAAEQEKARSMAIASIKANHPEWGGYFNNDGSLDQSVIEDYPQGFEDFKKAVNEAEAEILNKTIKPSTITPKGREIIR